MTEALSIRLNTLGLFAVTVVLLFAFADQLFYHDLPCPLCLLQRAGVCAVGIGLALNICFGPRPSHYGLMILSAVAGGGIAVRQILLHIVPGTGTYGDAFLGLHFYTWALIVFFAVVVGAAAMLVFDSQFTPNRQSKGRLTGWTLIALALFGLVTLADAGSTLLECGSGLCPENPTRYQLLQ